MEHTYQEYQEAIARFDSITAYLIIADPTDEQTEQYKNDLSWLATHGFPTDAVNIIGLMGFETVKCPRCCADVSHADGIDNELVCPGCYNTIPEKELREVLSRPKCLQEVPHG